MNATEVHIETIANLSRRSLDILDLEQDLTLSSAENDLSVEHVWHRP